MTSPWDNPRARRSALEIAERLRTLSETERDMIRLVGTPGFRRWLDQIHNIGGCADPIYLAGRTTTRDAVTGAVMRVYTTADEPGGVLALRCGNRRETRCAPCSRIHAGDTFHLVRAGLLGGKEVPSTVTGHPRLFITLTAPGFGAVHRATDSRDRKCRPRRDGGECPHGRLIGCNQVHSEADPRVGQPICGRCYDYAAHVLWHAKAGALWNRTTILIRRHLAAAMGITQRTLNSHLRVSFAKVAEYQKRGAIHLHAVVRADGPSGPDDAPPPAVTAEILETVVRSAAGAAEARTPYAPGLGEHVISWGAEIDVHAIHSADSEIDGVPMTDEAVAAYIAKYVSKSVGEVGGIDRRITSAGEIGRLRVSPHVRALMGTCWRLGGVVELAPLRLRLWAHALGYRGHVLTKSRRYSTTYEQLRAVRAEYRKTKAAGGSVPVDVPTDVESAWRYVRSGHTSAEAEIAAGVSQDLSRNRDVGRSELCNEEGRRDYD
ncbi:replication initiator [Streptomyces sp. NPDC094472]|uniref:replication initiator n=1 Tax=Streptomyces sp. NPDC094472 TaxID=3155080 RepID=UPI0033245E8E